MTYRQRLTLAANRAPRITIYCPHMVQAFDLESRRVRASVYASRHPMPRASFN